MKRSGKEGLGWLVVSFLSRVSIQCMQNAILLYQFCPSVRLSMPALCLNECTHFWLWYRGVILVFRATRPSQMEPLAGASNTRKLEKFAIFDRNCRLSRKHYKIGPNHSDCGSLIGSQRQPIDPCRFRWPCDLERRDAKDSIFFPADLCNYARTVWPRTTTFDRGGGLWEGRISTGQPRPHPKGAGPSVPENIWDFLHMRQRYHIAW